MHGQWTNRFLPSKKFNFIYKVRQGSNNLSRTENEVKILTTPISFL